MAVFWMTNDGVRMESGGENMATLRVSFWSDRDEAERHARDKAAHERIPAKPILPLSSYTTTTVKLPDDWAKDIAASMGTVGVQSCTHCGAREGLYHRENCPMGQYTQVAMGNQNEGSNSPYGVTLLEMMNRAAGFIAVQPVAATHPRNLALERAIGQRDDNPLLGAGRWTA